MCYLLGKCIVNTSLYRLVAVFNINIKKISKKYLTNEFSYFILSMLIVSPAISAII